MPRMTFLLEVTALKNPLAQGSDSASKASRSLFQLGATTEDITIPEVFPACPRKV
jgi:hypothetical protein